MFESKKIDEIGKGLLAAAELIEKRGWWDGKGDYATSCLRQGKVCAALAINEAFEARTRHEVARAYDRLLRQIGARSRGEVPAWNDNSNAETVIRVMREAAYNQT